MFVNKSAEKGYCREDGLLRRDKGEFDPTSKKKKMLNSREQLRVDLHINYVT